MGLIFRLSLRNLLRQKKRNFFLGIGIAFGMAILVIANSFSHGMVDVLIQDIVTNAFGHLVVQATPGNSYYSVIRDKQYVEDIIRDVIPDDELLYINESLGMMGTAIGRGESDNVMVVGVTVETEEDKDEFFNDFFTLVDGDFADYTNPEYEYPVIISEQKAKSLNVGLHDTLRFRVPMITGQVQAARFTVIAVANANNTFMDIVLFMDGRSVKELMGYQPWESAGLQVTLKDPKGTATRYADLIHQRLTPEMLSIVGHVDEQPAHILAFRNTEEAKQEILEHITLVSGDEESVLARDGVMLSNKLANSLGLNVGDDFTYSYETRWRGIYHEDFTVNGVFTSSTALGEDVILLNEERIHSTFSRYLPSQTDSDLIAKDSSVYPLLATEWKLLDRTANFQEMNEQARDERRVRTNQTKFSVLTMYEGASEILRLEEVLNLITVIAVLVLFFIILIGVMNTLRMTIRERTREIGTVRAIGMQRKDVRNMFILEVVLLTAVSCLMGILGGVVIMKLLGSIQFDSTSVLSMILKDGRIFFKMNPVAVTTNFFFILVISCITAYFPARYAANRSAVEALRHYE